ncbi:4Fe-4S binding protein [Natroniella sulfidigena]|uniref:4Fe-4S binding protein n=1 Tax=Natroniella sulfidigena TaxID=723921 RepID=UPI00200A4706|nr:4Fe-4S binding protein [Natroniella sulfidigena]MCK8817675.1 4Fe-4S binding protein [Natroniella sulfidigena]
MIANIKKYSWVLVPTIAFGGLFYPLLGLAMIGIMLGIILIGLFNGKYWCGNLCPHGSLFDVLISKFSISRKIPAFFKSSFLKWGFFIFFMGMFSRRLMNVMATWGSEEFLDNLGLMFTMQYLIMPTILGVSLAILISPRTWCSFCPMGAMGQIMGKLGNVLGINRTFEQRITINQPTECRECGLCANNCPLELEPYTNFDQENRFDDDRCIKCAECVEACPINILELKKRDEVTKDTVRRV